jgi:hypothetical protein
MTPDEQLRIQAALLQRYPEWQCGSQRSGLRDQQCDSPQTEAQFSLVAISNETTKSYYQVISQLDHQHIADVEDIITSPPQKNRYTMMRTELINRLSLLREQRIHQPPHP